jgi:SET domain-containing protein
MLKPPTKIVVKNSNLHGLGVFSLESISENEILEECHFILLQEENFDKIDKSLKDYVFSNQNKKENSCVVLGFGMIYNHSLLPNADWEFDSEKNIFRFFSKKKIEPNKEIFINYKKWVDF